MDYEFHFFCTLFPEADEKTLSEMAADIKENGLNEPIVLYEGKILDGRNRYLACKRVSVEPTFKEYTGGEPLQYVVSRNLHRRHLNESQRAILAQRVWKLSKDNGAPITQDAAREQFNVSAASVRKAARIEEAAIDDIKKKVEQGVLSINKAANVVKKAQKVTGVDTATASKEDLEKLHQAQEKILKNADGGTPLPELQNENAEEFNEAVLSGVYDGKRYRRDVQEIQSIVASMETLPTLFNDAISMVGMMEQEKLLVALVDTMLSTVKKAAKKFQSSSATYDDILATVASLMDGRFKIPEMETTPERELLEQLKRQYLDDCEAYAKDAIKLKKRIKAGMVEDGVTPQ